MPSPSVSALHGSRPTVGSSPLVRPSASESPPGLVFRPAWQIWYGVSVVPPAPPAPPPPPEPPGLGEMTGDSPLEVKLLEKRLARTRSWKRVATGAPFFVPRNEASLAGTTTEIRFDVELVLLAKIAGLPLRLKTTVFLPPLPARKPVPVIFSVSPMRSFSGETFLMTGNGTLFLDEAALAEAGTTTSSVQASR